MTAKYVLYTSDLHAGITHPKKVEDMLSHARRQLEKLDGELTAVVLCGDQGETLGLQESCLRQLKKELPGVIVAGVPGNHCLNPSLDFYDDIEERYFQRIAEIFHHYDYLYLDIGDELVIEDTAIIGNIGWYDYSALNDMNEYFGELIPAEDWQSYKFTSKIYPDCNVRWRTTTDIGFAQERRETLVQQLEDLEEDGSIKDVVVVTHHPLLYRELREIIGWNAFNRKIDFMFYNPTLGQVIEHFPKLKMTVSGHIHYGSSIVRNRGEEKSPLHMYTIESNYNKPRYLLFRVGDYTNPIRYGDEIKL